MESGSKFSMMFQNYDQVWKDGEARKKRSWGRRPRRAVRLHGDEMTREGAWEMAKW
jgi:hypothetical protein